MGIDNAHHNFNILPNESMLMFFSRNQPTVIAPSQVASTIVQLIEESRERLILISPYFLPWHHLDRALRDATERGVKIDLIIRSENVEEAMPSIASLQLDARHIERLHAKLYVSERGSIISSMNLLRGSRDSLESGLLIAGTSKLHTQLAEQAEKSFLATAKPLETITRGTYLDPTHFETLKLRQKGFSADQIASERGFKVSTIYSHFEAIAAARRLPIEELVEPVRINSIQKALEACGVDSALSVIKNHCSAEMSVEYWEIAAVRNFNGYATHD